MKHDWGEERLGRADGLAPLVLIPDLIPYRVCTRCGLSDRMAEHMGWTECNPALEPEERV